MPGQTLYRDRRDAGRKLGRRLRSVLSTDVLVLGLPRGGVEVAFEVAQMLKAPLDVLVARKVSVPYEPELGFGAVGPGDVTCLDEDTIRHAGLTDVDVRVAIDAARGDALEKARHYRGTTDAPNLRDRVVVLVDDGLATGLTALAAVRSARQAGAVRIILAVPVCPRDTASRIRQEVDEFVCLDQPEDFEAVGRWYDRFRQTTDAEVIELLEEARDAVAPDELKES